MRTFSTNLICQSTQLIFIELHVKIIRINQSYKLIYQRKKQLDETVQRW